MTTDVDGRFRLSDTHGADQLQVGADGSVSIGSATSTNGVSITSSVGSSVVLQGGPEVVVSASDPSMPAVLSLTAGVSSSYGLVTETFGSFHLMDGQGQPQLSVSGAGAIGLGQGGRANSHIAAVCGWPV